MLPLRQLTPAPRKNHKVTIVAVQVERRQPSEEAKPSKCPPPFSCYPNSYPGNLWLLEQWLMLLLPLLLTLPGKFFFYSFFIYLLFILSIYSTEQVLNESRVSIALLSAHNQPPPPSCHLDPTSPGFISANWMPSKRTSWKMEVMKGEKMRRLKMKMRMKMRKKPKSMKTMKTTKMTTMRQHHHQHQHQQPAPLPCLPLTP